MRLFYWIGCLVGWFKGTFHIKSTPKAPLKPGDYMYDMWGERDADGNVILTPPPADWQPPKR